jgi:hypothetical protein
MLIVIIGLLAAAVTVAPPTEAPAAVAAPNTGSFPDCLGDDDDDTDPQCLPNSDTTDVQAIVLGSFGGPGTITIRTSFLYPACDLFTATTNCYFSVDRPTISGCTYIDGDATDPQDCGSYEDLYKDPPENVGDEFTYESGTATSFSGVVTQLRCSGQYDTLYVFGGDQRTDFVWRERGPKTANCDITIDLPTPDALPGETFLQVRVGGRVCEADSGINCSKSRSVKAYAWLRVFGSEATDKVEPVDPARVFDTRPDEETVDGDGKGNGPLPAGSTTCFKVTGRAGVPANASAVIVNATAIQAASVGFITLFAKGSNRPQTSSLNFAPGGAVGNTAIVQVGTGGEICVYNSTSVGLVLDVTSYVGDTEAVRPLEPSRLVDSRESGETADGVDEAEGRLEAGEELEVQVTGRGGVPTDTVAVAVNATVVSPDDVGFITLYPCDGAAPVTSSLNYNAGQTTGNSGIVGLSDEGTLCVISDEDTDIVLDVTTSFSEDEDFDAFLPARLLDTRAGLQTVDGESAGDGKFEAGDVRKVQVAGRSDVPSDAKAAAVNVTAVRPEGNGFVTLFSCDEARPLASSLNFGARDFAVGNSAVVTLSDDGSLCVYAHEATHITMDVNAAFSGAE